MGTKRNPGKFDCYAKAEPDEPTFVLLGRDLVACATVEFWTLLRGIVKKDNLSEQNEDALATSEAMREWAKTLGKDHEVEVANEVMKVIIGIFERSGKT